MESIIYVHDITDGFLAQCVDIVGNHIVGIHMIWATGLSGFMFHVSL